MVLALLVGCAADRVFVAVNVTDGPSSEIVRGAKIVLMETRDQGDDRVTRRVGSTCFEVGGAVSDGEGTLSVSVVAATGQDALALAQIPADAVVRAGICHSDATPLARARPDPMWAVAIPSSVPADFADAMWAGDQVEIIASFPGPPSFTTSLGSAMVAGPGFVSVAPHQARRLFRALDAGHLSLSLEPSQAERSHEHLATLVPEGMRFIAVSLPGASLGAFVSVAEAVDVTVDVDGQALRALRAIPVFPLEPARRTLVAAVTMEQARTWAHAAAAVPVTLSLRLEADLRALSLPIAPGVSPGVGDRVGVGEQGALELLTGEVLDLQAGPAGEPLALVQVSDDDVLAAALAGVLQVTRIHTD